MFDVRDYIKPAIEKSGTLQRMVAEKSGLTQQQLSDVMAKRRRLDANEFINLCVAINLTPDEVVSAGIVKKEIPVSLK